MKDKHDASYKLLFSHPEMVRDLVRGFIPDPWLQGLDFSTQTHTRALDPGGTITAKSAHAGASEAERLEGAENDLGRAF